MKMVITCFRCHNINSFSLYPWIHQWTNNKTSADQIEAVKFPDVDPSDLPPNTNFSMAAGDFLEVYVEPGKAHRIIFNPLYTNGFFPLV